MPSGASIYNTGAHRNQIWTENTHAAGSDQLEHYRLGSLKNAREIRENRQKTLAALNDLWQGNPIRRTRQGEGSFTLYGRRLAVHLMVQPGVARAFMADPLEHPAEELKPLAAQDPQDPGVHLLP